MAPAELAGRTIGITADRRWEEQADLFRRRGADVLHGATMRTIDLAESHALRAATHALAARPPDVLVATTGMGMRRWLEAAAAWGIDLVGVLRDTRVLARGAKSASAVRGAGLAVAWQAPSERMDDIVERDELAGARVALQLFDPLGHPSTVAIRARAGELVEVPVYQWDLPEDPSPARALIEAVTGGEVAAVTFTSQPAVHHLFRLAEPLGVADPIRDALNGPVLAACVGPVCNEAAMAEGVTAAVWPEPPRLVAMVRLVTERLRRDGGPGAGAGEAR